MGSGMSGSKAVSSASHRYVGAQMCSTAAPIPTAIGPQRPSSKATTIGGTGVTPPPTPSSIPPPPPTPHSDPPQ